MTEDTAVEFRQVWKIFGPHPADALNAVRSGSLTKSELMERHQSVVAVADASFQVVRGEIFCVMGLSGSGKSTLLRHINRLIAPTAGEVLVLGENVAAKPERDMRQLRAEKIGMVFQSFALLPHLTVLENAGFGLELRGVARPERNRRAGEMLELVKLGEWGARFPHELSGGMQQRVGLARALAGNPEILLMDEPFGALDPLIRRELQDQFLSLARQLGKTTVFITLDLDVALRIGSRIAIMRDGAIVQCGRPGDILKRPADDYVRAFAAGILAKDHVTRALEDA